MQIYLPLETILSEKVNSKLQCNNPENTLKQFLMEEKGM
jgi:hypothetical protein